MRLHASHLGGGAPMAPGPCATCAKRHAETAKPWLTACRLGVPKTVIHDTPEMQVGQPIFLPCVVTVPLKANSLFPSLLTLYISSSLFSRVHADISHAKMALDQPKTSCFWLRAWKKADCSALILRLDLHPRDRE